MTDNILFGVVGGLGLFLFGMHIMSEGLQKIAGRSMRRILGMLTKTTIGGIAVGAGVTAIIQSSSATTVMLIGFVQAGLLTLKQSIGVILGANIGTTITAQIIAFKIHKYALPCIGLGVLLHFFVPKKSAKYFGQFLLGFGMLFFGLAVMTSVFEPLKSSPEFQQLFVTFSKNPLLALLTGMVLTMMIQSSSATVGITMTLAGVGLLDFTTSFAVILGDNIGTTITAQLAALNANITAKRTAWAHTLFKVFGAAYMIVLLGVQIKGKPVFLYVVDLVTPGNVWLGQNVERHVANTHTIFNVINCLIFLPLTGFMVFVVTKMIRGEVEVIEHGTKFLDERMLVTPEIAVGQAKKEITRMAQYAREQLDYSIESIFAKNHREREELYEKVRRREETVNLLEREISSFLIRIDQQSITEEMSRTTAAYLHLIHDIERIGDISENIIDLVKLKDEENIKFSGTADKEVRQLSSYVDRGTELTIKAFENWDEKAAEEAIEMEGRIDATEQAYRDNHIARLGKAECDPKSGIVFLDILSNLERAGDHAHNVAKKILELNSFH
ncbi:Na/Pi cotransporter family protein [Candidatus Margulisiibacteriota bacterium]